MSAADRNDGGPAFPMTCGKCGCTFTPRDWQVTSRDHRCLPCKRVQQNAMNAAKGDALKDEARAAYQRRKDYYTRYWQEARNDPGHIQKRAARRKVATEIEAGRLTRQPCGVCGEAKSDAHHHDYSSPLDVQWLCRRCHFAIERQPAQIADAMLRERDK